MEPPPIPPTSSSLPPRIPPLVTSQSAARVPPPLPGRTIELRWFIYYRLWCILLAVIWAGFLTYGILIVCGVAEPSAARVQAIGEAQSDAVGMSIFMGGIMLFYALAGFVPRNPWGWTVGFIAIIGSMIPLLITVAGMIPLLIAWVKPETKVAFLKKP